MKNVDLVLALRVSGFALNKNRMDKKIRKITSSIKNISSQDVE